jgi:hypothetical protein
VASDPRFEGLTLPDYQGGGIVNLMGSIAAALGVPLPYPHLTALPAAELAQARRLVLLVVDGLGYEFLLGHDGHLRRHLRASLTSVFPSTTASAIPTFLTGLPPQQHGLTGWNMYFREIGTVASPLPFRTRLGHHPLRASGISPAALLGLTPIFDRIPLFCHAVGPQRIIHSDLNVALSGRARRHGYETLEEMFSVIASLVRSTGPRSYVYAYWPELDSLAHDYGIASAEVAAAFAALDSAYGRFLEDIQGSGSLVLVTADHGFIDTVADDVVDLDTHPELRETLRLPLCGEPRAAYCYVRPGRTAEFEAYVRGRLAKRALLMKSEETIRLGWFGPGEAHPELPGRVGDYTLIALGRTCLRDWVPGEERYAHIGVHGGLSAAEMRVPLIFARSA